MNIDKNLFHLQLECFGNPFDINWWEKFIKRNGILIEEGYQGSWKNTLIVFQ